MSSRDFLILDEACFDSQLGRPAKAVVSVDSITSIQECVFDDFITMDKQGTFVGSVIAVDAGTTVVLKVRDKVQDILLNIMELTHGKNFKIEEGWHDQFEVKAAPESPSNNVDSENR